MIFRTVIPDLGATGGPVRLTEWTAKVGLWVEAGAPLFVVETDKAVHEVESFEGGYLRKILVAEGAEVEIGAEVAILTTTPDEPWQVAPSTSARRQAEADRPVPPASDHRRRTPGGRILASPYARKLARTLGVDLATIAADRKGLTLRARDILAASSSTSAPSSRRAPLSPLRRSIACHTARSKSEVPHFYVGASIDMNEALRLRAGWIQASNDVAPGINDLILVAAGRALRETPALNAIFLGHEGNEIEYQDDVSLGMVVAIPDGIQIPIIRRIDERSLVEVARLANDFKLRARRGALAGHELTGGTMSVSNLGTHGVERFTAIISPPQSAILACGAARPAPVVRGDALAIGQVMEVNLSIDHRVADGVTGAAFLGRLKYWLEHPWDLVGDPGNHPSPRQLRNRAHDP